MDVFNELMNPNKILIKRVVKTGEVNGRTKPSVEKVFDFEFNLDDSTKYATKYQRKERDLYENYSQLESQEYMSSVDSPDDLMSTTTRVELDTLKQEQSREMFAKYRFDIFKNQQLVIDSYRDEVIRLVNISDVVIIHGPTGCGKTTQVPQFILDDCKSKDKPCKIIVTQPRRIAAISVARRVCDERGWALGQLCGYQVGLENQTSGDTLLSYVTTGVLLQKLIKQKNLHEYTHIIVDEVHERNQDMDFLLLIIRRFLNTNSSGVKIILMSATFDTNEFSKYFQIHSSSRLIPSPVLNITKESKYKTQIFFSEQLALIGDVPMNLKDEPKIEPQMYNLFVNLIATLDRLDPRNSDTNNPVIGNVLVFLPGIYEIEEAHDRLVAYSKKAREVSEKNVIGWHILPLHSSITIEEQRRVFQTPPLGMRKIILSTNIAESSITVPDILYVVDFCLTKTLVIDSASQYPSLQLQWASHVNCNQRAGRVGRVANGRVYRLVSLNFYDKSMRKNVVPEMLRAPLHRLILASKLLELNEPPKAILALAMNPPNLSNIDSTVLYLKQIGGLSLTLNGKRTAYDGEITFMGVVMANLPLDVHLSKLIVLGHLFSCLDDTIIMATGCSLSTFKSPFKERQKAYANRLLWADSSASDLIAYLNLYKVWQRQKQMSRDVNMEKDWCSKNYVSQRVMKEWTILIKEIKDRLQKIHIGQSEGPGHIVLNEVEKPLVIKIIISGSFYPNYFKRCSDVNELQEREAVKLLGGRDPYNTVYFNNFPLEQPGPIYARHIRKYLQNCASNMKISFDGTSKVYVQFLNSNPKNICIYGKNYFQGMPGKIAVEVYRAVQQRSVSFPCEFKIMKKEKAWKYAKEYNVEKNENMHLKNVISKENDEESLQLKSSVIPSLKTPFITICICHKMDAGHFWAQKLDTNCKETLFKFHEVLNTQNLRNIDVKNFDSSLYYATKFEADGLYYRCKILSLKPFGNKRSGMAEIIFIDYGNTAVVALENLFELPENPLMKTSPQAIECFLSEIQPSIIANPRALWSEIANSIFAGKTNDEAFLGEIYSVVDGIVRLRLYKHTQNPTDFKFETSLNYWFIKNGYAQLSEESFLSKENNLKRRKIAENPEILQLYSLEENHKVEKSSKEIEPPNDQLCSSFVKLRGPYSPLEISIYPLCRGITGKTVRIDLCSVNTVVLDTDPQDPHERLIVAGHIGQNTEGNVLTLSHTTMMPNIAGFPMLMTLLWCPFAEMKPTSNGCQIAAILGGLGSMNDSQRSLYPPLDICVVLDSELTVDDINKINELRYWLNMSIQSLYCDYNGFPISTTIEMCQDQLKSCLFQLLKLKRKRVNQEYVKNSNVWGEYAYDADLLQPGDSGIDNEIWPLHSTIKLEQNAEVKEFLLQHTTELQDVALGVRPISLILCQFCDIQLSSKHECLVHINSINHRSAVDKKIKELS